MKTRYKIHMMNGDVFYIEKIDMEELANRRWLEVPLSHSGWMNRAHPNKEYLNIAQIIRIEEIVDDTEEEK